jgi:CheY-like chemotaxis protein
LFLPFDRIDVGTSTIEGTGLGLTLSRDLMTAMGGTLHATSREGIGSTFTASIPLAPTNVDHQQPIPAVNTRTRFGASKTVLYIEDNPTNVGLLEQILAYRPHVTLRVAMLGRVGLEMALTDPPDLILLDLHLPDISGQEVLQRLRADPRTATTPVVILSADATPDRPQRLIALGATSYQTKPVKVPRILDLIDRLEESGAQPSAATIQPEINPISGSDPATVVAADPFINDFATTLSTFRHEMINLLGVVLTYSDLVASDETEPSKIAWLEKQGTVTEQAIELTQELRVPARGLD